MTQIVMSGLIGYRSRGFHFGKFDHSYNTQVTGKDTVGVYRPVFWSVGCLVSDPVIEIFEPTLGFCLTFSSQHQPAVV